MLTPKYLSFDELLQKDFLKYLVIKEHIAGTLNNVKIYLMTLKNYIIQMIQPKEKSFYGNGSVP